MPQIISFSSLERSQDIPTELVRSHTGCLINTEKILNGTITKFYNGDNVNVITAELGLPKTRPSYNYIRNIILGTALCS